MAKRKKADEATTTETADAAEAPAPVAAPAPEKKREHHHTGRKHLSYDEAMQMRRDGTLRRSVFTDQGWVTP